MEVRLEMRSLMTLTQREREVLRYVAYGLTNRQIAQQLVVSVATIQNHVHSILEKLEVSNRTMAVVVAQHRDILSVDKMDDLNQVLMNEKLYSDITASS